MVIPKGRFLAVPSNFFLINILFVYTRLVSEFYCGVSIKIKPYFISRLTGRFLFSAFISVLLVV